MRIARLIFTLLRLHAARLLRSFDEMSGWTNDRGDRVIFVQVSFQLPEPRGRQPGCVSGGPQVSGACASLKFRSSFWVVWFVRFVSSSSCLIVRADRFVGSMSRFPGR